MRCLEVMDKFFPQSCLESIAYWNTIRQQLCTFIGHMKNPLHISKAYNHTLHT